MQLLNPRAIRGGTYPQVLATAPDGDAEWTDIGDLIGDADGGRCLIPLTVVVDGEPGFLWTSDNQLMMAEVPL